MPSSEERMMILRMVEEGKIKPEEGARLLAALGEETVTDTTESAQTGWNSNRQFRVRVTDGVTGRQKVTVNLPLGLVDFGLRFVPSTKKFDAQSLRDALQNGLTGRIVDVMDEEKGDRVEIFIE